MNKKMRMLLWLIALMVINSFSFFALAMKKQSFSLDLKNVTNINRDIKDEGVVFVEAFCQACNDGNEKGLNDLISNNPLVDLLYDSHAVDSFCDAIKNNRLSVVKIVLKSEKGSFSLIRRGADFIPLFKKAFGVVCLNQLSDMATMLLMNKQIIEIFSLIMKDFLSELSDIMKKIKPKDTAAAKNWVKTAILTAYSHTDDKGVQVALNQILPLLDC